MAAVEPTTARQKILYTDTCDIWQPDTPSVTGTAEPIDTTYTKIASSQKCYYFTTPNVNTARPFGRYREFYLQTADIVHFPQGTTIGDNYIIKFTTSGSDMIDTFWRVQGDSRDRGTTSRRKAAVRECFLRQMREAPAGVS